jgi:hypothetical protein
MLHAFAVCAILWGRSQVDFHGGIRHRYVSLVTIRIVTADKTLLILPDAYIHLNKLSSSVEPLQ